MSNRIATGNFPGAGALSSTGKLFALGLDVVVGIFQRPFQTREFIEQCWFISRVCILPAALVSISFGSVISLQLGSLIRQFGAQSFSGAASTLAVIQQAAPVICALLVAGAGGSAICADLGARTIREEIDAMEVLGINPIQRLVVPRVLASILVSALLFGLVSIVGVAGGYYFNVVLQGVTPGAYVQGFSALSKPTDLLVGFIKAALFGLAAGIVAAYRGLNPAGGPKGVGDAVNQAVVITFIMLFAINVIVTAVYLNLVPPTKF
ncbi:MlaE family ABC transporter permease [Actinomycetospora flava]|uniref:ABC transporter permease n=1 Tax=Actinomycetospora flava TaxID=3129232 RepID=A0ABU8M8E3_9PSEU